MANRNLNFVQSSNNLRLLQTATFVAVLGCVVLGSSLLFRGSGGTATIADTLASASFSTLPASSVAPKPKTISEHAIVSAAVGVTSGTVRYYERDSGKAFSVVLATQRTDILSDKRLPGFLFSHWIPQTNSVVSAFQQPAGVEYRFYSYETGASSVIGSGIIDLAINPNGRRLAALKKNSDDSLSILYSSIDGATPTTILTTRIEEPRIAWRNDTELTITSRRADRPGRDLSLLNSEGILNALLTNKENLEVSWSPGGDYLLYSFFAPKTGISLHLRSLQTEGEVALNINTSADKCAWHPTGLTVTCGIPIQKSLTRDVSANRTATVDDIYTYDFENNTYLRVYGGTNSVLLGITEPFVSSNGDYLVFTNIFDSRLYALPL